MMEWIHSPSNRPESIALLLQKVPEFHPESRGKLWVESGKAHFPRSSFQVHDLGLVKKRVGAERRWVLLGLIDEEDVLQRAPSWLSGGDDYYWAWSDLVKAFRARMSQVQSHLNYYKENRDRLQFVLRSYELYPASGACRPSYQFEVKCLSQESLALHQAALERDSDLRSPSLEVKPIAIRPGIWIKVEVAVPSDSVIYFEKLTEALQLWFEVS